MKTAIGPTVETWEDLLALVREGVREDLRLDYKLEPYCSERKEEPKRAADKLELIIGEMLLHSRMVGAVC
jgi:hypothetical protein